MAGNDIGKGKVIFQSAKLKKKLVMPAVLAVLIIFFSFQNEVFFSASNFINILSSVSYTVIIGIGITFVMVSGSIDLSVGYQMSLVGVIIGRLVFDMGLTEPLAIIVGIFCGMLLGAFNGIMVIKLRVFPLIITLASQTIFQGISYIISKSITMHGYSKSFLFIGQGSVAQIPFSGILMVFLLAFSTFILKKTYFGRYVYAVGANEEGAHLAGINIKAYRVILFTICGLFSALGAIVLISRSGASASTIGPGAELTCLTGAIIGGISFRGGEGSPMGMLMGILLLKVLGNGMQLMGLGTYPQYVAQGIVLMVAIGLDSMQKNRKKVIKAIRA